MALPSNKTKIVCTIGPASDDQEIRELMLEAGMNIARLNFSHGDFPAHADTIRRVRVASKKTGRHLMIEA